MNNSISKKLRQIRKLIQGVLKQKEQPFISGETVIQTGCAVFGEDEIQAVIESLLSGWLGIAESAEQLENSFAKIIGFPLAVFVNSGSV